MSISSSCTTLLWWWGRGYNLSLTWDQPIANHNQPINSSQTGSSPAQWCIAPRQKII